MEEIVLKVFKVMAICGGLVLFYFMQKLFQSHRRPQQEKEDMEEGDNDNN